MLAAIAESCIPLRLPEGDLGGGIADCPWCIYSCCDGSRHTTFDEAVAASTAGETGVRGS